ncbi:MAG: hypothetical protein M1836_006150 [Candelina mexicana]|nr:MAG: hypothetical protein M1836_006150 [Candelina mexicana]
MRPRLPNTEGKEHCDSPIPQGKKRRYQRRYSRKSAPPKALQDEGQCWYLSEHARQHICNNQDLFAEFTAITGLGTVALSAIQPDGLLEAVGLINVLYDPTAPVNLVSLPLVRSKGIQFDPLDCVLRDPNGDFVAYAPLVNGIHQLQTAAAKPPSSALEDLSAIAADWSKDRSMTAAIKPSSSAEDRSAIAAFNDFETSLSEAHNDVANLYAHARALPALVRGGEASPGAPDAPEQDTRSVEGLLDEEDHDIKKPSLLEASEALASPGIMSHGKPSSLEATEALALPGTASRFAVTEALAMPGTMIGEHGIPCGGVLSDSSSAVCSAGKPSSLEATKALELPGTMIVGCSVDGDAEKPSLLEAAEALALPGTTYEHGIPCGGVLSDSSSAVCSVGNYEKPSLLEASEALVLPRPLDYQRSSTPCGGASGASSSAASLSEKPSLLEATEVLESPGTASRLAVTEALAVPGLIYGHDRCADRCIQKTSTGGQLIRSSGSNQLRSGLDRSVAKCDALKPTSIVAIRFTPTNRKPATYAAIQSTIRKSTTVAFIQQLATTCTSYFDNPIAPLDPGGIAPQDSLPLLLLPLRLPCLFDWHLRKPALRQRPSPKLLGTEDINGHWDKEGAGQAIAGGGGMAKELGIAAVAVLYSTVSAGWYSYGYSTLVADSGTAITIEQCTPYGGATPRKPSLFGGTRSDCTPYGGATHQKPSLRGNRKSTTQVANQQLVAECTSCQPFDPGGVRPPSPPRSSLVDAPFDAGGLFPLSASRNSFTITPSLSALCNSYHPFDPGGLSSLRSWLFDLPCCLLLAAAVSTPCLRCRCADSTLVAHGQRDINRDMLGGLWGCLGKGEGQSQWL